MPFPFAQTDRSARYGRIEMRYSTLTMNCNLLLINCFMKIKRIIRTRWGVSLAPCGRVGTTHAIPGCLA